MSSIYSWVCGLPPEPGQPTQGCALKGHWLSSCQQLLITISSSVGRWHFVPTSVFRLGFGLAWVCTGPVHATSTDVNSYAQLLCYMLEDVILFSCSYLPPKVLIFFPPPLSKIIPEPGKKGYDMDVPFKVENSTVSYCTLTSHGFLC